MSLAHLSLYRCTNGVPQVPTPEQRIREWEHRQEVKWGNTIFKFTEPPRTRSSPLLLRGGSN